MLGKIKKTILIFDPRKRATVAGKPIEFATELTNFRNLCQLEDRVLYSASPIGVSAELPIEQVVSDSMTYDDFANAAPIGAIEEVSSVDFLPPPPFGSDHELFVIDSRVENLSELLDEHLSDESVNATLIDIGSETDGILQLTEILESYTDLSAIHLFSHGESGAIQLGNTQLTSSTLEFYSDHIEAWGHALHQEGDILIYGCDVAAGSEGEWLISQIADLTSADISASTDSTGHADLGGNWILETTTGAQPELPNWLTNVNESWFSTLGVIAEADFFTANENEILSIDTSSGVLANDILENTGGTIAQSPELNFDASSDLTTNQTWENTSGIPNFDFTLSPTTTNNPVIDGPPSITSAYLFDGTAGATLTSTFADLASDPTTEAVSFETWFRPTSDVISDAYLFEIGSFDSGINLSIFTDNTDGATKLAFTVNGTASIAVVSDISAEVLSGSFIQAITTFNPLTGTAELFVNGSLVGSETNSSITDWSDSTESPALAGLSGSSKTISGQAIFSSFRGEIASFNFYRTLLSNVEIEQDYTASTSFLSVSNYDAVSQQNGTISMETDGSFIYDPGDNFDYLTGTETANDTFDYTVTDNVGNSETQTVQIQIFGQNDSPEDITYSNTTIDENIDTTGGYAVSNLSTSDADTNDSFSYSIVGGADSGKFTVTGSELKLTDGLIDFETQASYSVQVETKDAGNATFQKSYTLNVSNLDDTAPVITSANNIAVDENVPANQVIYTATADDSADVSNGVTFALSGTDAASFSINQNTGEVSILASPDAEGKDSYQFDIVATDAAGNSSTPHSILLSINNLDDTSPTITSPTNVDVNENVPVGLIIYTATADDSADVSNGFTFAISGPDASNFGIDQNTGEVRILISPNSDVKNSYQFDITATDADGNASAPHTVLLSINNLDDTPPTMTSGTNVAVDENIPANQIVYTATADDSADVSNGVTFAISGTDADSFSIDSTTGAVSILDSPDAELKSTYNITIVATDNANNASDPLDVTLNINDLNESPTAISPGVANILSGTDTTNGIKIADLETTDPDTGDSFTYSIVNDLDSEHFSLTNNFLSFDAGIVNGLLKSNYEIRLQVTDLGGNVFESTFTLNVTQTNQPPTEITPDTISIDENIDTTGGYDLGLISTVDPDVFETFTYAIIPGMDAIHFTLRGTQLDQLIFDDGSLDHETKSNYSVTIKVTDSQGNELESILSVQIVDVNEVPSSITLSTSTIPENSDAASGLAIGDLQTTDEDFGDTHSYEVTGGLDENKFRLGGVNGTTLILTDLLIDYENQATYQVQITATDSGGAMIQETITINVDDANDAPSGINPTNFFITENQGSDTGVVLGNLTTIDQDTNDAFTYSIIGGIDADSFQIGGLLNNQLIITEANIDFEAKDSYSVVIRSTDASFAHYDSTITVSVVDQNESPIELTPLDFSILENTSATPGIAIGSLSANDPDLNETFIYSIVSGFDSDYFSITGSTLYFTHDSIDYEQKDTYLTSILVQDSGGNQLTELISVNIMDENESPNDLLNTEYQITDNTDAATGRSLGKLNAVDPDANETFSYEILGGINPALFSIGGDNNDELILTAKTLDSATQPLLSVDVKVTDSGGNSYTETIAVNIISFNSAVLPNTFENNTINLTNDATLEATDGETSESELEITSEELIVETSIETVVTPSIGATPEQMDVGMIQAINSITRFDRAPQFTELVQDNYIFGESTTLSSALENASEKVVKTRFSSAEIAASPFESIFSGASLTSLNALQLEVSKDSLFSKSILGTTTIASASITAGYVIWLLRSGVLFSSMVTSLPAWRTFDPLPVLGYLNEVDNEQLEDDSLQTLVINSNRASKADNHEI